MLKKKRAQEKGWLWHSILTQHLEIRYFFLFPHYFLYASRGHSCSNHIRFTQSLPKQKQVRKAIYFQQ